MIINGLNERLYGYHHFQSSFSFHFHFSRLETPLPEIASAKAHFHLETKKRRAEITGSQHINHFVITGATPNSITQHPQT